MLRLNILDIAPDMLRVLLPQSIFSITVLTLENSPAWVNEICERVAARLASVDGIRAVALGGSRARGTAREDSDIDLALYYDPTAWCAETFRWQRLMGE
jgi:hypothetical protein